MSAILEELQGMRDFFQDGIQSSMDMIERRGRQVAALDAAIEAIKKGQPDGLSKERP